MMAPVAGAVVTLLWVIARNSPGATTIGPPLKSKVAGSPATGVPGAEVAEAREVAHKGTRRGALVVPVTKEPNSAVAIDTAVCP